MGILVSPRELVTCAHVVDAAVDGDDRVRVCFPFAAGLVIRIGRLDRARYAAATDGDIAVVVLEDGDGPAPVAKMAAHRDRANFTAYGFRRIAVEHGDWTSHDSGELVHGVIRGRLPGGRVQLDGTPLKGWLERGYSGGGVYDAELDSVVGMVVAVDRDPSRKMAQSVDVESLRRVIGLTHQEPASPPLGLRRILKRVPNVPVDQNLVVRPQALNSLKAQLLRPNCGSRPTTVAVAGAGGIGKTVLAHLASSDYEIQTRFVDGIVSVSIGQRATPTSILDEIRDIPRLLGCRETVGDWSYKTSPDRLETLLADKAVLLVVDDVWTPDQLAWLPRNLNHSRVLVTTRNADIFDPRTTTTIKADPLSQQEARELLALQAGLDHARQLPSEADVILARCRGLAVVIATAGAMVSDGVYWASLVGIFQQDELFELGHPRETPLWLVIESSLDSLSPDHQSRYLCCAVFRDDREIPVSTFSALWSCSQEVAQSTLVRLSRRALLTVDHCGHVTFHDMYLSYLRARARRDGTTTANHLRLLNGYRTRCTAGLWWKVPDDGYFLAELEHHLRAAGHTAEAETLCTSPPWIRKLLANRLLRLVEETESQVRRYSPLAAQLKPESKTDLMVKDWDAGGVLTYLFAAQAEEHPPKQFADVRAAFREVNRAVILGGPGAGKSMTLRLLAVDLAREALRDEHARVPLLLRLGNWRDDSPLSQFVAEQVPELARLVDGWASCGQMALLLDGLDEMPRASRKEKAQAIRKWVESLDAETLVFVSCRLGDYTGDLDLGLDTLTLQELKPWRVREVLRLWVTNGGGTIQEADRFFWQLAGHEDLAGVSETWLAAGSSEERFWTATDIRDEKEVYSKTSGQQDALWRRHVRDTRSLVRLAANPFLLTMIFLVWRVHKGELPRNLGQLFDQFVDGLLGRERLLQGSVETKGLRRSPRGEQLVAGLTQLAWQMQAARLAAVREDSGDFGVLTVTSKQEALAALDGDVDLLKKALDGTLLEGEEEVRFQHQLLQEYFTAVALQNRIKEMSATALWPADRWWERSGWEEAAVLLAGLHGDDCSAAVQWVAEAQPEVAARCATELGAKLPDVVKEQFKARWAPLLTDVKRQPQPKARAAIGRALWQLGLDNRKGVGVDGDGVPDIDWVEIPGGPYKYQGKRKKVESFFMARYPVTNAQFDAFVRAEDGYRQDRWWEGLAEPDRNYRTPEWTEGNHPRETVNWYEAMAFCGWVSSRLQYEVRLPTEYEWERAAAGTDGREYPWGNEYKEGFSNVYEPEQQLRRTSAVGMYPHGASAEGAMDLAGNVWEWCLNEYAEPERTQKEGTEPRVLRGGSWDGNQAGAGAGCRGYGHPFFRDYETGFRVVCSSPIHAER
jgi:hypothetical protein